MSNLIKSYDHAQDASAIVNNIFRGDETFEAKALAAFRYQYQNNPVYRQWCKGIGAGADTATLADIPFLPVAFFKTHRVVSNAAEAEKVFESSGTTGQQTSRHYVTDAALYTQSFLQAFELFYGLVEDWCVIGLLPAYLERTGSSLVVMVDELIRRSGHPQSGFYLNEFEKLHQVLSELEAKGQKVFLIGVTFALLDFAEQYPMPLQHTVVVETGGMKGRKKEMIRQEVHDYLQQQWKLEQVHSEYGMTELLSQAYATEQGLFRCPPWMRVLVRDEEDPLTVRTTGRGVINIIDLANIHSCCFIAVDDAGVLYEDGAFEVLGRIDQSDIRGCSLLVI
jgi:hypothetical protein